MAALCLCLQHHSKQTLAKYQKGRQVSGYVASEVELSAGWSSEFCNRKKISAKTSWTDQIKIKQIIYEMITSPFLDVRSCFSRAQHYFWPWASARILNSSYFENELAKTTKVLFLFFMKNSTSLNLCFSRFCTENPLGGKDWIQNTKWHNPTFPNILELSKNLKTVSSSIIPNYKMLNPKKV